MSKDVNLLSYVDSFGVNHMDVMNGSGYSDALHLSDCHNFSLFSPEIRGGSEDCVDINQGCLISIHVDRLWSGGKYVFTVKGGAEDIQLSGCIYKHGSVTDVDIGNWSDQNKHGRTKFVRLCLNTTDGSPVRVRVLHGWRPEIINPEQPYIISTWRKGWFNAVYSIGKDLHVV